MTGFVPLNGLVGAQPPSDIWVPTTTQNFPLGYTMSGYDAYFGWGEFVYAKAAAAQEVGSLVYFTNAYVATDIPNTANTGFPVAVAKAEMAADSYGWYQTSGMAPWSATASIAAGAALGVTGAGTVGANTAGKQILGARVVGAGTLAITKTGTTSLGPAGIRTITLPNVDGLFVGMAVSGTGVGAAAVIDSINPGGNSIVVTVDSTAAGTVTVTFTYTNFLQVMFNAPFVQGAIT
jgi:hypothetical protein